MLFSSCILNTCGNIFRTNNWTAISGSVMTMIYLILTDCIFFEFLPNNCIRVHRFVTIFNKEPEKWIIMLYNHNASPDVSIADRSDIPMYYSKPHPSFLQQVLNPMMSQPHNPSVCGADKRLASASGTSAESDVRLSDLCCGRRVNIRHF
jgi:hypothetical protein